MGISDDAFERVDGVSGGVNKLVLHVDRHDQSLDPVGLRRLQKQRKYCPCDKTQTVGNVLEAIILRTQHREVR